MLYQIFILVHDQILKTNTSAQSSENDTEVFPEQHSRPQECAKW